ncbi:hypothetical protein KUTeg_006018 [Tegillarca granosa]|uniref:Major facilitator superfamily (MFS) profile domain-containing protein n=1 Tax=Tegillarca granosa TaxID=220873 RepID=A0ABQ9FFD4_TEGGR|nr:hypothetical protein KUTeg_006018 [Tegillarca granosa]
MRKEYTDAISEAANCEENEKEYLRKLKESVPFWTSQRLFVAVFAFFGLFNSFALRSNISLSIVCMVNHTAVQKSNDASNVTYIANVTFTNNTRDIIFELLGLLSFIGCRLHKVSVRITMFVAFFEFLEKLFWLSTLQDGELLWDRKIQGYVLGSFFWAYSIVQIPSGILVTKFGGKRVFGWSMILASITTVITPIASRFHFICAVALRAMLGVCLGPAYPAIQYLWGRWAPPEERSRLSALSFPGGEVGSMFTFVITGYLCTFGIDGGWPSTFYLTGVLALIWAVAWLLLLSDSPLQSKRISLKEKNYLLTAIKSNRVNKRMKTTTIPWKSILTSPRVYAIIVTHFTTDWANYLMLTCIPTYIDDILSTILNNGYFQKLLPVKLNNQKESSNVLPSDYIQKFITAKIIPALLLIGLGYVDCTSPITAVTIMTVSIAFRGFRFAGYIVNAVDIAPTYAGFIFGISNTAGAFAGFLATFTVSYFTTNALREEWQIVFYVTAGMECFGAIFFVLFARSDIQPWATQNNEKIIYKADASAKKY